MEWYQTGGADFSASSADYTYDAMGGTSTSATYGSFEDEAPLLEGELCLSHFCHLFAERTCLLRASEQASGFFQAAWLEGMAKNIPLRDGLSLCRRVGD